MEKKYQVFISSTYKDLKTARKRVSETILSMGHFPVGMEMFGASDDEQWKIIQKTIDLSDYYIVIVGKCFGSQVPGEDISYTQKEFRYAKEKHIPILAFIAAPNADIAKTYQDTEEDKIIKLNAFVKELETGRTVDYWENYDNLATKVAVSLPKEISSHPMPGWIRENEDTTGKNSTESKTKKSSSNRNAQLIADKLKKDSLQYHSTDMQGNVVFRYDNNNGEYTLGQGDYTFLTKWSQSGNNSIHAYGKIGYLPNVTEMPDWNDIPKFDFSSRSRTVRKDQIVIFMNAQAQFVAIKMGNIKSSGHGYPYDEMEFEYRIYTDNQKTDDDDDNYKKQCIDEYRILRIKADKMLFRYAKLIANPDVVSNDELKQASSDFAELAEKYHVFANKINGMKIDIPDANSLISVSRCFTGLSNGILQYHGESILSRIDTNARFEERIKGILNIKD